MRFGIAYSIVALALSSAAAGSPEVSVKVRVWTQGGEPGRNAYVALVPVWRWWSDPVAETIAENGAATFRVPRGVYHVVAAARGSQIAIEGPFRFLDDAGAAVDVSPKPLKEASGVVIDADGKPLAGVRVAQSRGAILPPLGAVSELAYRHLSGDWSTVTDQGGRWKLALPDDATPLLFTADHYEPQWRIYSADEKDASKSAHVTMSAGAGLRIECDRADPDLVVTVERDGPDRGGSVPHEWQRIVWAQRAAAQTVAWPSLPAGTYSIYAKYPAPAFFTSRAAKIGSVTLAEGRTSNAGIKLPDRPRASKSMAALFVEGIQTAELSDGLQAFAVSAAGTPQRTRSGLQNAIGGSVIYIDAEGLRGPFYAAQPDRFIAPDPGAPPAADLKRVPAAANIYGRADAYAVIHSAEKDIELPAGGTAVWNDCGQGRRVAVPVDLQKGTARLTAAAGCRNGALSFAPFEPLLVSRPLRAGHQELGEYLLHAAAAADVRVVRDPDGAAAPDAVVRAMAVDVRAPSADWIPAAEARSGPDGWAHFDAVPAQRTLQFIAQTGSGESSAAAEGRAERRGRLVIDPLTIPKPAAIVVVPKIKAAVRSVFPSARVMNVSVETADDRRADAEKREHEIAEGESEIRFEHLKPGRWIVRAWIRVAGTDGFVKAGEIDLKSGETRRIDADLEPLVFSGRVTVGGKGVAAHVYLRNASGEGQHFESRADGTYYAVLSAAGVYVADVARVEAQSIQMRAGEVAFEDPARRVDIAVPAPATVVVHVRAQTRPVPDALITATQTQSTSGGIERAGLGHRADARGDWKFENLVPGEWLFSVREQEKGGGGQKSLTLHEAETAEVELDVEKSPSIAGRIRDAAGAAVPDVLVDCLVLGGAGIPVRLSARTDVDGRFSVDTYAQLSVPATCSMTTAGGVVDSFKALSDNWLDLQLPASTATLQIADWDTHYSADTFWLAAPDGRAISLGAVSQMAPHWGASLRIDALAAGRWRVLRIGSIPQYKVLASGQAGALTPLADVALDAGAAKTIRIYDIPAH